MIRKTRAGFTLIEVTLAIVIGVIIIAGAVLVYNQAKASAGNSRAQSKVSALQQLIEESASANAGQYPSRLDDINVWWKKKRPDDWNKSPWGGVIGTDFKPGDADLGNGVANRTETDKFQFTGFATHPASGSAADAQKAPHPTMVGGMVYDYDQENKTWSYGTAFSAGDLSTHGRKTVKGYAVYICDQTGAFPYFVSGGKP
ncbi:MAG: prepilin-type N-terminal cleavage/methylation domain-containing protein [Candidatus Sericytochromatia bacterium]|nr:prepilin-type N-terminal cleavage/methylation domain-containing protein [Candidatus Tanganyikabacteria bacterium]